MATTFRIPPKGQARQTCMEMYKIRELWFGLNGINKDRVSAMQLASQCIHPDAQWLCGKAKIIGHMIYLTSGINFETETIGDPFDKYFIEQSGMLGHSFGQVCLSMLCSINKQFDLKFKYAQASALQGDRDGMFLLGNCYYRGYGCVIDESKALDLFYMSAKLGNNLAMLALGRMLKQVDHASGSYWIGKAFHRTPIQRIDLDWHKHYYDYVTYYQHQLYMHRKMVDAWSLVGKRLNVVKDIRILIAKKIWKQRKYVQAPEEPGLLKSVFKLFGF